MPSTVKPVMTKSFPPAYFPLYNPASFLAPGRLRRRNRGRPVCFWKSQIDAHRQPVSAPGARRQAPEVEGSGARGLAAKARGVHARVHDDAQEAELGTAQGG